MHPSWPQILRNATVGMLIGVGLGLAIALLLAHLGVLDSVWSVMAVGIAVGSSLGSVWAKITGGSSSAGPSRG